MDDEYDEIKKAGLAADGHAVTYIWNIKSLARPKQTGHYKSAVRTVDHNQYIHNGRSYQSNYGSGFRILDVSSIPSDPTGNGVKEIGFFDIYPEDDNALGGGTPAFVGSWSSYANFKSGFMYVNTIERGGYVVKYNPRPASAGSAAPATPAALPPQGQSQAEVEEQEEREEDDEDDSERRRIIG